MNLKEQITQRLIRVIRTESSEVFGVDLTLRELMRTEFRAAARASQMGADIDVDRWWGGVFAAGVIDEAGQPLFTLDEILSWPHRAVVWDEVSRIAGLILDLSEAGPPFRASDGPASDDGERAGPD